MLEAPGGSAARCHLRLKEDVSRTLSPIPAAVWEPLAAGFRGTDGPDLCLTIVRSMVLPGPLLVNHLKPRG